MRTAVILFTIVILPRPVAPGHPKAQTIRVLATLRQFLREGTPWRSLRADAHKVSGSTLRRWLTASARTGLLRKVHALLVAMLRGSPDLILGSCSVRAKRGGDLTAPNPTDRAKRGTKYHVATTGDGIPVACIATAGNINDTVLFERLFLAAFAVMARITTVFADKAYDAEANRILCRRFHVVPHIHNAAARTDQAWKAALAGRTQQCLDTGEQAPRAAL